MKFDHEIIKDAICEKVPLLKEKTLYLKMSMVLIMGILWLRIENSYGVIVSQSK